MEIMGSIANQPMRQSGSGKGGWVSGSSRHWRFLSGSPRQVESVSVICFKIGSWRQEICFDGRLTEPLHGRCPRLSTRPRHSISTRRRMRIRRSCRTGCHRDRPRGNGDMHWRNVRSTLFPEALYYKASDTDLRQTYSWTDDFEAVHRIRQDEGSEQGDALIPPLCYWTQRQVHQAVPRELRE